MSYRSESSRQTEGKTPIGLCTVLKSTGIFHLAQRQLSFPAIAF
jgi:hypothetical protein